MKKLVLQTSTLMHIFRVVVVDISVHFTSGVEGCGFSLVL